MTWGGRGEGGIPWTALSSTCKTGPDWCCHPGQQKMWILIFEIVCGESTITCVLYDRTKSLGKIGEHLWWSSSQDFPFNLLISEASLFYSPNLSVVLWFWSVSFEGIEIWGKQGGENWTLSLFHCSHRTSCLALQGSLGVLGSAHIQSLTSAVFDSMILELFSKVNKSVILCVWIALQRAQASCNSQVLVE